MPRAAILLEPVIRTRRLPRQITPDKPRQVNHEGRMSRESFIWLAAVLWLNTGPVQSHVETRPIRLPTITGATAIWGATGADATGHIWLGVSSGTAAHVSAHLVEYDPATDTAVDRGNVLEELKRIGLLREGEIQMTIHTRIV